MPRTYSAATLRQINATSTEEAPLLLLEIEHPDLSEPIRVVHDNDDFPHSDALFWRANRAIALNEIVVPTVFNGRYYKCTVAGGTGAGPEPIWPTTLNATVTSGSVTFRCEGYQYRGVQFSATLPDDKTKQMPRARLAIDNVGRELTGWIELSGGAEGATVRMMQVMRSAPTVIEWEVTMDLTNIRMTPTQISGDLGFEDILNKPAVAVSYRPDIAPGLF